MALKTAAGTKLSYKSACVHIAGGEVDPAGVTHELLHIERYWIEGVPMIIARNPANNHITSQIENTLEHLIIVPRELEYGFGDRTHWNTRSALRWQSYPNPMVNEMTQRLNGFLGWLSVKEIVTDQSIVEVAKNLLKEQGLYDEAQRFHANIMKTIHHKQDALVTVLRFARLPPNAFQITKYDVPNKKEMHSVFPGS